MQEHIREYGSPDKVSEGETEMVGGLRFALLTLVTLVSVASVTSVASQTAGPSVEPEAVTQQVFEAINAGIGTEAARRFSESAVLEGFGLCPGNRCVGTAAIQGGVKTAVDERLHLIVLAPITRQTPSRVTGRVDILSDSISRGGAQRLVYEFASEVQNGRIVSLTLMPVLTDRQTAAFLGVGMPASVGGRMMPPSTGDGGLR
jgi:hypothetical protein